LEEGDLHSLFSDNKQLIDDDSDLDAQEYKTANTQVDIDVNSDKVITDLGQMKYVTCLFSSLNCALVVTNALLFKSFPNKTFSGDVSTTPSS
jgi:hypothetical protein